MKPVLRKAASELALASSRLKDLGIPPHRPFEEDCEITEESLIKGAK